MSWEAYLSLILVCSVGAMSPGPSLAVVMQHARLGRSPGVACALGHGLAVLIYALMVVFGLYSLLTAYPKLMPMMQLLGSLWLLKMAYGLIFRSNTNSDPTQGSQDNVSPSQLASQPPESPVTLESASKAQMQRWRSTALIDGFAIAFLNPKIALFMLALFSQWLYAGQPLYEKLVMGLIAGVIDGLWYALVALMFSHKVAAKLLAQQWVDQCLAFLLAAIALVVIVQFLLGT